MNTVGTGANSVRPPRGERAQQFSIIEQYRFARLDCVRRVSRVVFVDEVTAVDAESCGAGTDDETGEYYW